MTVVYRITPARMDGVGRREYDIPASTCDVCEEPARVVVVRNHTGQSTASAYCARHVPTTFAPTDQQVMEAAPVDWHISITPAADPGVGVNVSHRHTAWAGSHYLGFARQSTMGTAVAPMRDWWTPRPRPSNWWTRWWAWLREVWTVLDRTH